MTLRRRRGVGERVGDGDCGGRGWHIERCSKVEVFECDCVSVCVCVCVCVCVSARNLVHNEIHNIWKPREALLVKYFFQVVARSNQRAKDTSVLDRPLWKGTVHLGLPTVWSENKYALCQPVCVWFINAREVTC